jgi:hypothetical protein
MESRPVVVLIERRIVVLIHRIDTFCSICFLGILLLLQHNSKKKIVLPLFHLIFPLDTKVRTGDKSGRLSGNFVDNF